MAPKGIPSSLLPDVIFPGALSYASPGDTTEVDATSLLSEYIAAKQQVDRLRMMLGCQPEHNLEQVIAGLLVSHDRLNALTDILREVIDG
jgi:hypothetical protein